MQQQTVVQTSIPGNNVNPYPGRVVFNVPPYVPPETVRYRDRQSKGLGATMITIGILCIIFNIVSIVLSTTWNNGGVGTVSFVGHGIWCGILFIISGSFGVSAARTKSKCAIITFMVMCIISSVLCISLLSVGILGACLAKSQFYYQNTYYNDYGYRYDYPHYSAPYCYVYSSKCNAIVAMEACLAVMAVIEAILSIWGAAICCRAVCCCGRTTAGVVYSTPPYNTSGQVMFINQQQSGQPLMAPYGPPMYPGVYPIQNQWGYTSVGVMVASDAPSYNQMENPLLAPPTGVPPPMYDNPGATVYNSPPPPFQEKQAMEY